MIEQLPKEMGGKLEMFYCAFGSDNFAIILHLRSNMDIACYRHVARTSGMLKSRATVLMTLRMVIKLYKRIVDFGSLHRLGA